MAGVVESQPDAEDYTDFFAFGLAGNRVLKLRGWDANGNGQLDAGEPVSGRTAYHYNERDQLLGEGPDADQDGVPDTLTETYAYDDNGSTTLKSSDGQDTIYIWDLRNKLVGLDADGDGTLDDAGDATFAYDFAGVRVRRSVIGEQTTWFYGASDPNDKLGPHGYSTHNFVLSDVMLPYRIRFENVGPGSIDPVTSEPFAPEQWATAPAQRVAMTDQLSPLLDWSTFRLGEMGFGDTIVSLPSDSTYYEGVTSLNYNGRTFDVHLFAGIDLATGRVITVDWGDQSPMQIIPLNPDGTFDLQHLYADSGVYVIAVTVVDRWDLTDTTTLTATVANAPPSANFGNDGDIAEGSTGLVSFTDATDPSPADEDAGFLYSYDFDDDGVFEIADTASPTAIIPAKYLADGPASRLVRGRITDQDGGYADYSTTLTVRNVAPVLDLVDAATLRGQEPLSITGSFADPGDDTWLATVDWADGSGPQALTLGSDKTFVLNHVFDMHGTYLVTVTIDDQDGGVTTDTVAVTVLFNAIRGTDGDDRWILRLDEAGAAMQIFRNVPVTEPPTFTVTYDGLEPLAVDGFGGDDKLVNGDGDLDGRIDGSDYFRLDHGHLASGRGYPAGDINHDGRIDGDDYFLIDAAFLTQNQAPLAGAAITPDASSSSDAEGQGASAVLTQASLHGAPRFAYEVAIDPGRPLLSPSDDEVVEGTIRDLLIDAEGVF